VFIDAGTTAAALALSIGDVRGTTIITNSLDAAQALKGNTSVETILLGGRIHTATRSLVGPLALENIRRFHFAKAFLGANGVCCNTGFSQSTLDEVPIKRCAAENASEVYILADSSKFNNQHLILFLETEKATAVITDLGASGSDRAALEEKGLKVIIAT
jgi:DeoR family transcriptional regulator, fructose operon transcriptional repressor